MWIKESCKECNCNNLANLSMNCVLENIIVQNSKIHVHTLLGTMILLSYIHISSFLTWYNLLSNIYLGIKCYDVCNLLLIVKKELYIHIYVCAHKENISKCIGYTVFLIFLQVKMFVLYLLLFYRSEIFQNKSK